MCDSEVIEKEHVAWTNERKDQLFNMWAEGKSAAEVAKILGLAESTIYSQARRLGLGYFVNEKFGDKRAKLSKLRSCLCCKKKFLSEGAHNRLCDVCKSNNDLMSGY